MAESKTTPHEGDVTAFLDGIADPQRQADAKAARDLFSRATGVGPRMWGASIVGFGDYHYSYDSGREGDTFVVGFSPRKASLTLYLMDGFEKYGDLLDRLGKHSTGKACLYIKRMTDIDPAERSGEARSVLVPAPGCPRRHSRSRCGSRRSGRS